MKKLAFVLVIVSALALAASAFTVFADDSATAIGAAPAASDEIPATIGAEPENAGEQASDGVTGTKALAAAIVVAVAAAAGAIGMAIAIANSASAMSRQPEAAGKINSAMMLGLVFIETLVIYALIVAILVIFVL